jgi:large subunit ribosomal protein L3
MEGGQLPYSVGQMLMVSMAVQIGYHAVTENRIKKPELGHCNKAGTPPLRHLREFRVKDPAQLEGFEVGTKIELGQLFQVDQLVDIAGTTIGKGFQGTIKRWGHKRGPMTHGAQFLQTASHCQT